MSFRISRSIVIKGLVVVLLIAGLLPMATPAHAVTAAIGQLFANCGLFSVDVAVSGFNNDGNNVDKFRYQLTDATGKVLYIEDAARQVGVTAGSLVLNLAYNAGTPGKNPIKFAVIDLDANNNPGAEIQSATYDAPNCLSPSGTASRTGTFVPPKNVGGNVVTTTNIYQGPNAGQMNLTVGAGSSWNVLYRSGDNQWVAIFVGSSNIVWIPSKTIQTNLGALTTPPTRIDGSSLQTSPGGGSSGGTVVIPPGTVIATVFVNSLNFRSAPGIDADVLATIPFRTTLPVIGRNRSGAWIKVTFSGMQGWVSSRFIRLTGSTLSGLPVVS